MQLSEANQLLDSLHSPFESGWKRLDSGVIHIAVRTPMPGVAPEMIDWWLEFLHHTEEYKWWHPRDHVWSDWEVAAPPGEYIGRTHLVHEYVGGHLAKLRISFKDPGEILDRKRFKDANVGTAVWAYVGAIGETNYLGRLLHLVQRTPEGWAMRSRFWLGEIHPARNPRPAPEIIKEKVSDALGAGLFAHCCEEMSILAGFLPTVYRLYNPTS
jgi:DAPG hydrolase PhiG domain